jgi:hypothetical protein
MNDQCYIDRMATETQRGFKEEFLENISKFTQDQKNLFERIYTYWETRGELVPPTEMTTWIEATFGSLDAVKVQDFLKITNHVLYEGSIFNELRTKRPVIFDNQLSEIVKEIEKGSEGPFAHPLTGTPADTFGRIQGKFSVTASNVTKYDGLHGLVIYDDHNPLMFTRERLRDYFDVAQKWFDKAHEVNPKAIYPFYMWNCLWNAGSSVIHGHAQITLTEGQAYAKIEEMRSHALEYQEEFKSNYFEDDYQIHENLNLAFKKGDVMIHSKITPIKEKEIVITAKAFDDNLATIVGEVLKTVKENLGVVTFNVGVIIPPMAKTPEVWDHMPVIVRIVDRGNLSSKTADIGAMELFAQSVVGSNPYTVINALKKSMLG